MPVTLQKTQYPLTVDDVRAFMRDQPKFNPLLMDIEFPDEDLQRAIRFTMARYNAMTPQTTLMDPIYINEYVMLFGVTAFLLRSEGVRQLRNQVTAQDGNIAPVGLDEKQALYAQWADRMSQEFETYAKNIKIQDNMESMYDSFGSGYRYIGRGYRY